MSLVIKMEEKYKVVIFLHSLLLIMIIISIIISVINNNRIQKNCNDICNKLNFEECTDYTIIGKGSIDTIKIECDNNIILTDFEQCDSCKKRDKWNNCIKKELGLCIKQTGD